MAIRELMRSPKGEERYCFSDIGIVAALLMDCAEIVERNGRFEIKDAILPLAELDFTYLRMMKRRRTILPESPARKKEPLNFVANMAPALNESENEFVPIVCFAVKPIHGTFVVHEKKRRLWGRGRLWTPTRAYSIQSRKLFRTVGDVLHKYRESLKTDATTKRTAAGMLLLDANGEPMTAQKREVIEDVRVDNE